MKSLNWISGTGRSPYMAMPMAAPTIPASASGVSMTRSGPNSSMSPSVARKTPPNLPTSSPSTTTRGSRRISMRRASFTAWMMFQAGMSGAALDPALDEELARLVARAHERTGRDEAEAQRQALALQFGEHLGPHELRHRQVLLRGAQVLPEREDVAAHRAQIAHGLHHLVAPLAQAEHDAALGPHSGALVEVENGERLLVGGAAIAHPRREALHRLYVVRGDRGPRVGDHLQRLARALEVG